MVAGHQPLHPTCVAEGTVRCQWPGWCCTLHLQSFCEGDLSRFYAGILCAPAFADEKWPPHLGAACCVPLLALTSMGQRWQRHSLHVWLLWCSGLPLWPLPRLFPQRDDNGFGHNLVVAAYSFLLECIHNGKKTGSDLLEQTCMQRVTSEFNAPRRRCLASATIMTGKSYVSPPYCALRPSLRAKAALCAGH